MKTKNYLTKASAAAGIVLSFAVYGLHATSLKKVSAAKGTTISKRNDALVKMKIKNVEFGFDKAGISDDYYAELDRIAKLLVENNSSLKVSGHADNVGAYVYNWNLSKTRAQKVKDYLISKGADETRIASTEFGDTKPIATNSTSSGRQKNRRVEIQFVQ